MQVKKVKDIGLIGCEKWYIILNTCDLFIDKENFIIGTRENMSHYFKQEFNIEINKKSNLFKKIYKN